MRALKIELLLNKQWESLMSTRVTIVDYDAGNLRSVQRACMKVGIDADISADPDVIRQSDKVIFPGVGSAVTAVDTLQKRGLDIALKEFFQSGKPLLGICLGLQIVLEHTEEGDKNCLGLVSGACQRFEFNDRSIKVPHMGWNEVEITNSHPMLRNIESGDEVYFVHSYYALLENSAETLGTTEYGGTSFSSVIARDNLFATQFHLEKSGEVGLRLLAGLADWQGEAC